MSTTAPPRAGASGTPHGDDLPELAWEDLLVRTGGDAALAYEVALEMLSLLPGASQALAGMVAREDGDAVAHEAHKFRGALMTSGLPRAARAAADLEATARIAPDRTEAFVAFARELARAEVALEACLETRDSRRVPSAG